MENQSRVPVPTRIPPRRGPLAVSTAAGQFRIDPGWPLHLDADVAVTVDVVQGRIWLTDAGDRRDHFPSAGARLEFAAGSDLMIEAEGRSAVVVVTPGRQFAGASTDHGHAPGRPLVGLAALVDRATHHFLPGPSLPRSGGERPDDGNGEGDGDRANRVGPIGSRRWLRAWLVALGSERARMRSSRLLSTLDSRQLRDIGASEHVIFRREQLEREARMRARMLGDGI